jgi:hypothetical protein
LTASDSLGINRTATLPTPRIVESVFAAGDQWAGQVTAELAVDG